MDAPAAGGQVDADLARWHAGADGWWGDPAEPVPALMARMDKLQDWQAEILPFLRPRLLRPGAVAGAAGRPAYVAGLSQNLYRGQQHFPVGLGPVEAIGTRLLGHVVSAEVARGEAETLGRHGDLIAPYAQALAMYLVQQADRNDPAQALLLATVVLAMADVAQPGTDVTPDGWTSWRWAADAYVEVACGALCRRADLELYRSTRLLVDSVVRWGADRDRGQRGESLALLGHFLLTPFTPNAGFLREDDPWRPVQDPMQPGNPRSTYALREAAAVLSDAVKAAPDRAAPRTWEQYVTAKEMVSMYDPDVASHKEHVVAAVSAARLALKYTAGAPPGQREYIEQVLRAQLSELAQL